MKKIILFIFIGLLSINLFSQKIESLPNTTTYESTDLMILDQSDATKNIKAEDLFGDFIIYDSLKVLGESRFDDTMRIIKPMYISGNLFNGTGVGSAAAGNTGEIQFNTGNIFNADPDLFWDNTNKYLGIGTNTPISMLDINNVGETAILGIRKDNSFSSIFVIQDDLGENIFKVNGSPTSGNSLIEFGDIDGASNDVVFVLDQSNLKYYFDEGNVGINTTNPSEKLDVNGNILVQDTAKIDIILSSDDTLRIINHLKIDSSIIIDSTEQSYNEGALYYDKDLKALTFYNDLPDFSHQLGYEHVARYYNNTGSTINDGTLLTPVGQKINGSIIPTVQIAGNGSVDSLKMVAMSTTATLDGEFGVVTLSGPVNNLDLSAYSDNDFMYVGHNGEFTNTSPSPPDYSLLIGKVFYADNDSGQIYMMPGTIDFTPSPHINADTSRANFAITINTQNVFEYIPVGSAEINDNAGFTIAGDSIQPQVAGWYTIVLSMSFQGNPTAETWRYGLFINNIEEVTKSRSTSSSENGDTNVPASRYLDVTDWVSFRMTNESGTGNPTVIDLGYEFIFLHE